MSIKTRNARRNMYVASFYSNRAFRKWARANNGY